MKKQVIRIWSTIVVLILGGVVNIYGQSPITFTFTGINDLDYIQLDSIKVKNLTLNCDTVLYYPDTALTIYNVGMNEGAVPGDGFRVMQNYPNPSGGNTSVTIYLPQEGVVKITIFDVTGRNLLSSDRKLEEGFHSFRLTFPGDGVFLFNARWDINSSTVRIISAYTTSTNGCSITYSGTRQTHTLLKSISTDPFLFNPGDQLLMIGYGNGLESGLADTPETSNDYIFQFAANIPCPGLDSLLYDGKWYHTTQIFSQCWMKENLNAGTRIPSSQSQTNNSIVERYCLGDVEYYCNLFGGLYFWNEMMNYSTHTGGQGICPDGWHIPCDLDWQILEGAADSVLGIDDPIWGTNGWRGTDAGGHLKQTGTELWMYPNTGATDAFGFTALPAGYFVQGGFWGAEYKNYLWSSQQGQKYYRNLDWNQAMIQRNAGGNEVAFSVRCVKN